MLSPFSISELDLPQRAKLFLACLSVSRVLVDYCWLPIHRFVTLPPWSHSFSRGEMTKRSICNVGHGSPGIPPHEPGVIDPFFIFSDSLGLCTSNLSCGKDLVRRELKRDHQIG